MRSSKALNGFPAGEFSRVRRRNITVVTYLDLVLGHEMDQIDMIRILTVPTPMLLSPLSPLIFAESGAGFTSASVHAARAPHGYPVSLLPEGPRFASGSG